MILRDSPTRQVRVITESPNRAGWTKVQVLVEPESSASAVEPGPPIAVRTSLLTPERTQERTQERGLFGVGASPLVLPSSVTSSPAAAVNDTSDVASPGAAINNTSDVAPVVEDTDQPAVDDTSGANLDQPDPNRSSGRRRGRAGDGGADVGHESLAPFLREHRLDMHASLIGSFADSTDDLIEVRAR